MTVTAQNSFGNKAVTALMTFIEIIKPVALKALIKTAN
jgi:acyl-CoA hydrolase